MRRMAVLGVFLAVVAGSAAAQEKLAYVDLVRDLTNLERLARLPVAGEKCGQFSSYDRASRFDEVTGKYVAWDANGDAHGVIRNEGGWQVLAEMKGPGCIRRIWSADPRGGRVRIFLDDAAEPAVDLPFIGYFNRSNPPFTYPSLVHKTASGYNGYVPIPYQKSCKIVAESGWGSYYHFTYQTFPEGTVVPTFTRDLPAEAVAALEKADALLAGKLGVDPAGERPRERVVRTVVRAEPGKGTWVLALAGPRAITAIRARIDLPSPPLDRSVLRELTLAIRWDDETEAAVWAPLGDFFGTAPGRNAYRSLPLGVTTDGGWYSFWYMPFDNRALIELKNDGTVPREVTFEITHAPLSRPIDQFGRFHAKWHRDAFPPEEPERRLDWTLLKTTGRGRFCGVMLHVWNPNGGWWGEGDEKFFVDREKFPSTFGTGSEDYFGYAWCDPELFQHGYHNQTLSMGNRGHISVNRWHVADDVPFHESFEATIEKYSPNDRPTLYASTVYWYLAPGGEDPYAALPVAERVAEDWPRQVSPIQEAREPTGRPPEVVNVESTVGEKRPDGPE
ncbi:MAG TPA: glycoside hydrolase family 172 protein [Planctomycetota bacterium]|nr:glycoside hydrolase family 172 protein [Planctomycetota bacterium]